MEKIDLAWQAGIIDGEGCITIGRQIRKGRPSPAFRAVVTVANTDIALVEPFQKAWGGNYYKRPDKRMAKNWADSFTWHCPDKNVVPFLEAVLPYLRAKKTQATLLIEFQKTKHNFVRHSLGQGKGSAPLTIDEINYRQDMWNKVREQNHKGVYARSLA